MPRQRNNSLVLIPLPFIVIAALLKGEGSLFLSPLVVEALVYPISHCSRFIRIVTRIGFPSEPSTWTSTTAVSYQHSLNPWVLGGHVSNKCNSFLKSIPSIAPMTRKSTISNMTPYCCNTTYEILCTEQQTESGHSLDHRVPSGRTEEMIIITKIGMLKRLSNTHTCSFGGLLRRRVICIK
ncbi:hypothetical protein BX600DRAFT_9053 [Xylariales sp. PMI_506]|nr:hypothetical protein BX600DRAFT_9053 [Xylariales sp. PMI_506]